MLFIFHFSKNCLVFRERLSVKNIILFRFFTSRMLTPLSFLTPNRRLKHNFSIINLSREGFKKSAPHWENLHPSPACFSLICSYVNKVYNFYLCDAVCSIKSIFYSQAKLIKNYIFENAYFYRLLKFLESKFFVD